MATNRAFTPDSDEYEVTMASGEKRTVKSGNGLTSSTANTNKAFTPDSAVTPATGVGGKTGGWTTGVYGTAILTDNRGGRPDMSRRADLAGKTAISNGYTVTYDNLGYATKATKGAYDYAPTKDYYVGKGTYNGGNLWTDEEMLTSDDLNTIQGYRNQIAAGTMTSDEANQLANKIRAGYGYTIDKSGNVYDSGRSTSVYLDRAKKGLDVGNLNDAQKQYLKLMFKEQNTDSTNALLQAFDDLKKGQYNPNVMYDKNAVRLPAETTAATEAANYSNAVAGAGALGAAGLQFGGYSDMTQYLENMYANNLQAELAALKGAYDKNVAELESQNDKIADQYRAARNQTAATNDIEKQNMTERAAASGLNTGTSGQMALSQSMAYQGALGNLQKQQAADQAAVNMALADLAREYNTGVNQATAASNAEMAKAIYSEMIRQQDLAASQQKDAKSYALSMLQNGLMPDEATLSAAGLSPTEAELWYQYGKQANAPKATGTPRAAGMTLANAKLMAEEGQFTDAVLKAFYDAGFNDDYLSSYYGYTGLGSPAGNDVPAGPGVDNTQFSAYKNYIIQTLKNGNSDRANEMLSSVWNQLSIQQRNDLQARLSAIGVNFQL